MYLNEHSGDTANLKLFARNKQNNNQQMENQMLICRFAESIKSHFKVTIYE